MISPPSRTAEAATRHRLDGLAKPTGALGRVEDLAAWLAACQGSCPPRPPERVRLTVHQREDPGRYPALRLGDGLVFHGLPWGYELSSLVYGIADTGGVNERTLVVPADDPSTGVELRCGETCADFWTWSPDDTRLFGSRFQEEDGTLLHLIADPATGTVTEAGAGPTAAAGSLDASVVMLAGLLLACYSVGAWTSDRSAAVGGLGVGVLVGLTMLRTPVPPPEARDIATALLVLGGAWLVGLVVRQVRVARGHPLTRRATVGATATVPPARRTAPAPCRTRSSAPADNATGSAGKARRPPSPASAKWPDSAPPACGMRTGTPAPPAPA